MLHNVTNYYIFFQRESNLEEKLKEKIKSYQELKEENVSLNKQIESFTTGQTKLAGRQNHNFEH